jgi:Fur family ferric uptake transcriptional regulator
MSKTKRSRKLEEELLVNANALLAGTSLKRTKSRIAILAFLLRNHGPFRIEEIHAGVGDVRLDLVTVYRTLTSLEELGIVNRITLNDSVARYELVHEHDHHHHVQCTACQKIEIFHDCTVGRLEKRVTMLGYTKVKHSLEFFGLCPTCSATT